MARLTNTGDIVEYAIVTDDVKPHVQHGVPSVHTRILCSGTLPVQVVVKDILFCSNLIDYLSILPAVLRIYAGLLCCITMTRSYRSR